MTFLGEPFVVEEIGRRLAFLTDNHGNLIELSAPMVDPQPNAAAGAGDDRDLPSRRPIAS